jgi:hypothetical protein
MAHGHHHYKHHNHQDHFNFNNYDYSHLLRKNGALRHANPPLRSGRIADVMNKQPNIILLSNPHIQKR